MARLYCDEQFPREVSELLWTMGHDVLTTQTAGNANLGIPDEAVLGFAIADNRAVLTLNRYDLFACTAHNQIMPELLSVPTMETEIDSLIAFMKQSAQKHPCLENSFVLSALLPSRLKEQAGMARALR